MEAKVRLNVNLDTDLKQKTAETLNALGLDFTTAITAYFKQIVSKQKIPFELSKSADESEIFNALQKEILIGYQAAVDGKTFSVQEAREQAKKWKL